MAEHTSCPEPSYDDVRKVSADTDNSTFGNQIMLKHYEAIVNSVPEAMSLINRAHCYEAVNDSWCAMLKRQREDVIGRTTADIWGQERSEHFIAPQLERIFAEKQALTHYASIELPSVGLRKCAITYYPYIHPSDGVTYAVVVTRDITELEQAREDAEAASRAKSTFLANMSHELRTPMHAIMGMTNLALRRAVDPKQKEQLDKVQHASNHLLALINDILNISRIEADRLTLESSHFKLNDVLENLKTLIGQQVMGKGLKLRFDIDPGLAHFPLVGDPLRLGQILLNLTGNAAKFSDAGTISLSVRPSEETAAYVLVRFEVHDNGIGISPEDQGRIFTAFEQADSSLTRKHGGTGLGLAISKRLVTMMKGEIGVASTPGQGSTFWFTARFGK